MNRNFAKPKADMTPEFGPDALVVDGRTILAPKAAHYARAGYLPLSHDWPVDPPEGKHYQRTGTIEPDGADGYRWVYRLVDDPPPPPRTFSKYRLVAALMEASLWNGVKAWIEATPGAYDLYLAAEDISEDEPLLAQGIAALKQELGIADEQIAAILDAAAI